MMSTSVNTAWAYSLVGRDWEIFWSEGDDGDAASEQGETSSDANDQPSTDAISLAESPKEDETSDSMNVEDEKKSPGQGDEDQKSDDASEGSIIDDWYAGHIKLCTPQKDGAFSFQVKFVGDDTDYDVVIDPSKVRPSARGWIKRAKALLCSSVQASTLVEWERSLPPDTSTLADQNDLLQLKNDLGPEKFEHLRVNKNGASESVDIPTLEDLSKVRRLQYLLQAQILLRSRLAIIVNHHGSTKEVGGEPNPTEAYVNHLVRCAKDLEQACAWFYRSWELHQSLLPDPNSLSGSSGGNISAITLEVLLEDYLNVGKSAVTACVSIDTSPTATKRRQPVSPTSRRTKRRKKNNMRFGNSSESFLDQFDKEDFLSTVCVDQFVQTLRANDGRWSLGLFGKMLQSLSHFIVDPVLAWSRQVDTLLMEKNDLVESAKEEGANRDEHDASDDDGADDMAENEKEQFFTYEDINACTREAEQSALLSRFNLSERQTKLKQKLADIDAFEARATELFSRIMEEAGHSSKASDDTLRGLISIDEAANSSNHAVSNLDPLGKAQSLLTRAVLKDAVTFRRWLLDLLHAEVVRERVSFVRNLASRSSNLPASIDSSELSNKRAAAIARIRDLSSLSDEHLSLLARCNSKIDDRSSDGIISSEGASSTLNELKKLPVVTLVEEKIAVRVDVLAWDEMASEVFSHKAPSVEYERLKVLNESLQLIVRGRSGTRAEIVKHLEPNTTIETEMCLFASNDVRNISDSLSKRVAALHSKALKWKERADSIISCLRVHGNNAAGECISTHKLPGMVDIKRISDLIGEYGSLEVHIPGYTGILENVHRDASQWSEALSKTVLEETHSFEENLFFLEKQRDERPRGIIMDPTRHVFDLLIDLLVWYRRVKEGLVKLASDAGPVMKEASDEDDAVEKYAALLSRYVYSVLIEGSEIVEVYNEVIKSHGQFGANSMRCVKTLESLYDLRKSARALSRERLESNQFGAAILSRMVERNVDLAEGAPLFLLLWFAWHCSVCEFVSRCTDTSDDEGDDVSRDFDNLSLADARKLKAQQPTLTAENLENLENVAPHVNFILETKTYDLRELDRVILESEQIESNVRETLAAAKNLLRGSLDKADNVRAHLSKLKELLADFKARAKGHSGVSLNPSIEPQLDHHIKIFSWLVRTFPFPILHLDEASYSAPIEEEDVSTVRVPWDVLITLHDRIPVSPDDRVGDFALVALRVKELYEAARAWQDQITNNTMISFRGGKRRAPSSSQDTEAEQDNSSQIQMEEMKRLAKNPILSKVLMPREGAVNGILQSSNKFEVQLHDFLGKDFDGANPDRAPYPETASLVGKRGEFILYRLTGSPIYMALKSSVISISSVADKVLAETPGKAAFDWIRKAIAWLVRLEEAACTDSPFHEAVGNAFVIPGDDAMQILKEGEETFLKIPEDLRKTLSHHGVFVSTNKQDKTLRVVSKKDGAHHSVGGTAIRWCAVLFHCLKSDISTLKDWEKDLSRVLTSFNAFFTETRSLPKNDEDVVYKWHGYREQVSGLLEEGKKSLVVSPTEGLVHSFQKLLNSINNYLDKHSNVELDQRFARRRYDDSMSLLDDRPRLLESLLYRKSLDGSQQFGPTENDAAPPQTTFRDTCRTYLEKALSKGMKLLSIDSLPEPPNTDEITAYCTLKAWEIENEMFDRFQESLGVNRVSDEYRDKARSLRTNLEGKNNLTLAPRVLLGEIDAAKLVDMTSEDLASQKVRLDRAKAEEAAKRSVMLTAPVVASEKKNGENGAKDLSEDLVKKESDENDTVTKDSDSASDGADEEKAEDFVAKLPKELPDETPMSSKSEMASILGLPSSNFDSKLEGAPLTPSSNLKEISSFSLKSITKLGPTKLSRPPPPPSLAASIQAAHIVPPPVSASARDRGLRVISSSGGDRFRMEIKGISISFRAGFYLEDESHIGVNMCLPEILAEKGRLKIQEFTNFVVGKLSGGKWVATPLRLTAYGDEDAKAYKTFYKDYEQRNRICMIESSPTCKVFLVTPKFHKAATSTGFISFMNRTSTYGVVLRREHF